MNAERDDLQVVDVRTPDDWKEGHVPGAAYIVLPEVAKTATRLGKPGNIPEGLAVGVAFGGIVPARNTRWMRLAGASFLPVLQYPLRRVVGELRAIA